MGRSLLNVLIHYVCIASPLTRDRSHAFCGEINNPVIMKGRCNFCKHTPRDKDVEKMWGSDSAE